MLKGHLMTMKNTNLAIDELTLTSASPAILHDSQTKFSLYQHKIYQHFIKSGEHYLSETEALGCAIRAILKERGHVNNKAIILYLILQLESESDVIQMDILRNTLEMVVGITPDDEGF